jgi:LppP/LprE lipoprotein
MRLTRLMVAFLGMGLFAAGCGWSPPGAPPTASATCTQTDGPTADVVAYETGQLPELPEGQRWRETVRGHTADCALHWVVVTSGDASESPQQVLFFDDNASVGAPTPDPRPYITVIPTGDDIATVQYQWRKGQDPACCPTGIATVRFKIEDGKLKALDPIPNL